jgi:Tetratricopeptide repeat
VADNPRIEELRRRVEKDPASIAFAQLAEEYRRAGSYEEAVTTCRAGLAIHPSYLSARVTLGRSLIEVHSLEEAETELLLVLQHAPENLAAIRSLAEIHHRRGELEQALAFYKSALGIARHDPDLEQTVDEISRAVAPAKPAVSDGMSLQQAKDEFAEFLDSFAQPAPKAEPAPAPQTVSEPQVRLEPQPESVPHLELVPQLERAPQVAAPPALAHEAEPEAEIVPEPDVVPEPQVEVESRVVAEPRFAGTPEIGRGLELKPQSELAAKPQFAAEPVLPTELEAEPDLLAELAAESGLLAQSAAEPGPPTQLAAELDLIARPAAERSLPAQLAPELGLRAQLAAEPDLSAKLEAEPGRKTEPALQALANPAVTGLERFLVAIQIYRRRRAV